ncbi:BA14K family protein [Microvirga guangxiensis]|uniref:Lectin-like protein BA14k n=1 Tax=Microvirga guangxiensis TaxID=549386 RepID=A0A1G5IUT5_9HYPH|nr:BA14K family protein [Microvirga guangxiensis]SCY79816.1 BA14K-like protein [Microvirga guangxiensis]
MRKLTVTLAGAGVVAATLLGAGLPAQAEPARKPALSKLERAYPNESYAQYYRRGYRPYYRHRHYRGYDGGSALAAGAVGLAAGALIGSAIASQAQAAPPPPPGTVDPQLAAYCARKYRSYDPVTGTFLSTNGMRYVCTY